MSMPPNARESSKSSSLTQAQVEEILRQCYPGMSETVLTSKEAKERSAMVHNDMKTVRFALRLGTSWPVQTQGFEPIWIPSYHLEGTMYGPEADPDGDNNRDAAGPLINCGEFVRLSKACMLGRKLLSPGDWPQKFASKLRDSQQHLSTIEEILWLGRWHAPQNVEMTYKQNPSSGKDIDWRFTCCGQTINLEVKYRMRDWLGIVDGHHFSRNFNSYFNDVEGKFGPRTGGELNIVGITTFTPPDRGLQACTERFLGTHPEIDAVIFWSIHDPNGKRPDIHARQPDLIKMLFKGGDREDNLFCAPIRHLWRKSDERRSMRPSEAMDAISMIALDHQKTRHVDKLESL
jgi:hypothetical protein